MDQVSLAYKFIDLLISNILPLISDLLAIALIYLFNKKKIIHYASIDKSWKIKEC